MLGYSARIAYHRTLQNDSLKPLVWGEVFRSRLGCQGKFASVVNAHPLIASHVLLSFVTLFGIETDKRNSAVIRKAGLSGAKSRYDNALLINTTSAMGRHLATQVERRGCR